VVLAKGHERIERDVRCHVFHDGEFVLEGQRLRGLEAKVLVSFGVPNQPFTHPFLNAPQLKAGVLACVFLELGGDGVLRVRNARGAYGARHRAGLGPFGKAFVVERVITWGCRDGMPQFRSRVAYRTILDPARVDALKINLESVNVPSTVVLTVLRAFVGALEGALDALAVNQASLTTHLKPNKCCCYQGGLWVL